MTDAQKLAAAVAELKLTTQGYLKSNGQPRALVGAQWKKGLDLLAQIGAASPPSAALPFAEADLRAGFNTLTVPVDAQNITAPAGKDCLIDLKGLKRTVGSLLIWGSGDQQIQVRNGYSEISKPIDGSPYWRGGPRIRTLDGVGPAHVSLTDWLITGPTLADGIAIAAGSNTVVTIQRTRVEAAANTPEPSEHLDAIQIQGKLKELNVGLSTLQAAGTLPGKDGGKCLQLKKEDGNGAFSVNLKKVNLVGRGVPGTSRFGHLLLQTTRDIAITLEEVYAASDPDGAGAWDFPAWFYPHKGTDPAIGYDVTGAKPNRVARWPAPANILGEIREGRPAAGDFVTRAVLGY